MFSIYALLFDPFFGWMRKVLLFRFSTPGLIQTSPVENNPNKEVIICFWFT